MEVRACVWSKHRVVHNFHSNQYIQYLGDLPLANSTLHKAFRQQTGDKPAFMHAILQSCTEPHPCFYTSDLRSSRHSPRYASIQQPGTETASKYRLHCFTHRSWSCQRWPPPPSASSGCGCSTPVMCSSMAQQGRVSLTFANRQA